MTDGKPLKIRKCRRASKRLGVKRKPRKTLSEAAKAAAHENVIKHQRKYAAKKAKQIRAAGGTQLTVWLSAAGKVRLRLLCKQTCLSQMNVIAALIDNADAQTIASATPTSPVVESRLEEMRRRIAKLQGIKP